MAKTGDEIKFAVTVENRGNVPETNIRYGFKNSRNGKINTIAKGSLAPGAAFLEKGVYEIKPTDEAHGKIQFIFSASSDVIKTPVNADLRVMRINPRPSKWSPWYNKDKPSGDGDFEIIASMIKLNKECEKPLAIECRHTSTKVDWKQAGQVYNCNLQLGGHCRNAKQPNYTSKNKLVCADYEARILCPVK